MPLHETSIPPLKCFVRREFLTGNPDHAGQYEKGVAVSVRSIPGSCALFQVLLENGALRDKLPIHAIHDWEHEHVYPFHHLQLWNSFSANFSIVEINFLSGLRVSVRMKDNTWAEGIYLWTMQWGPDYTNGADITLAIHPEEHKSGHFIALDCGEFAIQPNNRLRWHEPSHVTKPFPERPDYVVNEDEWNCEAYAKWQTEDSNAWHYGASEAKAEPNLNLHQPTA
jgi:hypothetical protein